MSADNGIYILKTRGQAGKPEYRVGYATAIDNIYYDDFDKYAYYWFNCSEVYSDRKVAVKFAEELFKRYEICNIGIENDIDFIDFGYIKFPTSGEDCYSHPSEIWDVTLRSDEDF